MTLRRWVAAIAVFAVAAVTSGCASPPPDGWCVPRITVTPSLASPGESITLTSDTKCDAPLPRDGWVVSAAHVGDGDEPLVSLISQDEFDGDFTATLELPTNFPLGEASAGIENWNYSDCSGSSGSRASPSGGFTVER